MNERPTVYERMTKEGLTLDARIKELEEKLDEALRSRDFWKVEAEGAREGGRRCMEKAKQFMKERDEARMALAGELVSNCEECGATLLDNTALIGIIDTLKREAAVAGHDRDRQADRANIALQGMREAQNLAAAYHYGRNIYSPETLTERFPWLEEYRHLPICSKWSGRVEECHICKGRTE